MAVLVEALDYGELQLPRLSRSVGALSRKHASIVTPPQRAETVWKRDTEIFQFLRKRNARRRMDAASLETQATCISRTGCLLSCCLWHRNRHRNRHRSRHSGRLDRPSATRTRTRTRAAKGAARGRGGKKSPVTKTATRAGRRRRRRRRRSVWRSGGRLLWRRRRRSRPSWCRSSGSRSGSFS